MGMVLGSTAFQPTADIQQIMTDLCLPYYSDPYPFTNNISLTAYLSTDSQFWGEKNSKLLHSEEKVQTRCLPKGYDFKFYPAE